WRIFLVPGAISARCSSPLSRFFRQVVCWYRPTPSGKRTLIAEVGKALLSPSQPGASRRGLVETKVLVLQHFHLQCVGNNDVTGQNRPLHRLVDAVRKPKLQTSPAPRDRSV